MIKKMLLYIMIIIGLSCTYRRNVMIFDDYKYIKTMEDKGAKINKKDTVKIKFFFLIIFLFVFPI